MPGQDSSARWVEITPSYAYRMIVTAIRRGYRAINLIGEQDVLSIRPLDKFANRPCDRVSAPNMANPTLSAISRGGRNRSAFVPLLQFRNSTLVPDERGTAGVFFRPNVDLGNSIVANNIALTRPLTGSCISRRAETSFKTRMIPGWGFSQTTTPVSINFRALTMGVTSRS